MKTYFGEETKKAIQNFQITGRPVDLHLIKAIAQVKIAAARANSKTGKISSKVANTIIKASEEIIEGEFDNQFPTDAIQGGAGTSINMNVNEVIAKRAAELSKEKVHYLDDVNASQSTNDVVPTAIRIVILQELDKYLSALSGLEKAFSKKANESKDITKVGRTHLQDAVPMKLGQEFGAYKHFVERDIKRLGEVKKYLLTTNLGGTAIGTSENATKEYITLVHKHLSKITGYNFRPAKDLVDATQNIDPFAHVAYLLELSATGLSKICTDLRVLASGPRAGLAEIILPEYQKGSSIMPGKVNPVTLEAMNQIAYQVIGNAQVASQVMLAGELELNTMLPVYFKNIIESFTILTNGVTMITETVANIKANKEMIKKHLDNSLILATKLSKYIGYEKAQELVQKATQNNTTLKEEASKAKIDKNMLSKVF